MKKLLRLISVLTATVLMLTMVSATAETTEEANTAGTLGTLMLTEEEIEKQSISNDKYNILLEAWADEDGVVSDTRGDFPDFYGGAYINGSKELVIQVTVLDDTIISYFDELIDLTDVIFEEVEYSFTELMQAHDEIAELMNPASDDEFIANISGVGLSVKENSVALYLDTSVDEIANVVSDDVVLTQTIHEKLSDFPNIVVIGEEGKVENCDTAEPGAEVINTYSGVNRSRSFGFWAISTSTYKIGFVTAPHTTMLAGDAVEVDGADFGTAGTPYYGGTVDAVFVERSNTDIIPSSYISGLGYAYSGSTIINAEGTVVYMTGFKTDLGVGEVSDIACSYTITVNDTTYSFSDCVKTTVQCEEGDSGGCVTTINDDGTLYVVGIVTGRGAISKQMIYVKFENIKSTLGIALYK